MSNQALTHVKKLRNPNYVGAYELITDWQNDEPIWKPLTVTIVKAVREKTKTAKAEEALVVYFAECKPMIVNSVNMNRIISIAGSPMDGHWKGVKVTLIVEKIFNKMERCFQHVVRINPETIKAVKEDLTPTHSSWESAKKSIASGNFTVEQVRKKYNLSTENEKLLCTF